MENELPLINLPDQVAEERKRGPDIPEILLPYSDYAWFASVAELCVPWVKQQVLTTLERLLNHFDRHELLCHWDLWLLALCAHLSRVDGLKAMDYRWAQRMMIIFYTQKTQNIKHNETLSDSQSN